MTTQIVYDYDIDYIDYIDYVHIDIDTHVYIGTFIWYGLYRHSYAQLQSQLYQSENRGPQ